MKFTMGSHLTNAANLSGDWGPPLCTSAISYVAVLQHHIRPPCELRGSLLVALADVGADCRGSEQSGLLRANYERDDSVR